VARLKAATIVIDKCKGIHILDGILPGIQVEMKNNALTVFMTDLYLFKFYLRLNSLTTVSKNSPSASKEFIFAFMEFQMSHSTNSSMFSQLSQEGCCLLGCNIV
jgi:hypothetical protein